MIKINLSLSRAGLLLRVDAPDVAKRRAVERELRNRVPASKFYRDGAAWVVSPAAADYLSRLLDALAESYGAAVEITGREVLDAGGAFNAFFDVLLGLKRDEPARYAREVSAGLAAQVERYARQTEARRGSRRREAA